MSIELSEQEQLRRQSLAALRELGIDPYPAARYEVTATAQEIADNYDEAKGNYDDVRIAGRIMSRRIMGSAAFFELQDHTGRIQVYIRRDDVCPEGDPTLYNTVFKKLLDIGDFIGVEGFAFHTNTGELSVHCRKFTVLSKSIRPLPVVKAKDGQTFDAFTDPEVRYRQRYVDLVVNPQVRDVFVRRAKIVATMRQFFNERGYVEVETPILQPIPGGASARPFITHHNALDIDQYLRIASELYLKKLIVGGFDGVYEFGKNFRNEGMDRQIDVTLAVADFGIGEGVERLAVLLLDHGQRADRLREHRELAAVHRQLARIGMEREAFDADEVADVEQFLEHRVIQRGIAFGADVVAADVDLNAARMVLQFEERSAAHDAARHDAACDADVPVVALGLVEVFGDLPRRGRHFVTGGGVGVDAQLAQGCERLSPELFLFTEFDAHIVCF